MILDAKPAKGVVVMSFHEFSEGDEGGPTLVDGYLIEPSALVQTSSARAIVVDVYTDHHATCPAAADWKGKHR
jgi:hypothetical protein